MVSIYSVIQFQSYEPVLALFPQVDVERAELKAIPEWISSGILEQVSQMGIELHTGKWAIPENKIFSELSLLLAEMRKLHEIGFRLISTSNNECVAKTDDIQHIFNNYIEVVFYKQHNSNL